MAEAAPGSLLSTMSSVGAVGAHDPAVHLGDEPPVALRGGCVGRLPGHDLRSGHEVREHGLLHLGDGYGVGGAELAHDQRHGLARYVMIGPAPAHFSPDPASR